MRIVITGPESSGKSTLAKHLSEKYEIPFAPEFARVYLEEHGPQYDYAQLGELSLNHLEWQKTHVPSNAPLGIFDTDLLNYKIWSETVFGRCHPNILEAIEKEQDHQYLLCKPDLPWEPDPLRQNPNNLEDLFQKHLQEIQSLNRHYRIVEGIGAARNHTAQQAYKKLTE